MPGGETVKVSVIDSTMRLSGLPVSSLLEPPMEGFDTLPPITTWSFLVESSTGKKALFDLGAPKDPFNHYAPSVVEMLTESGCDILVQANVADILEENGVQPAEINSIIWRCVIIGYCPSWGADTLQQSPPFRPHWRRLNFSCFN
jgi:hypothetical protein